MTSKVILQVDRLASLVDNNVASTTSSPATAAVTTSSSSSSSLERPQSVQQQQQHLSPPSNLLTSRHQAQVSLPCSASTAAASSSSSTVTKPITSLLEPSSPSSSLSSTSSSSSLSSTSPTSSIRAASGSDTKNNDSTTIEKRSVDSCKKIKITSCFALNSVPSSSSSSLPVATARPFSAVAGTSKKSPLITDTEAKSNFNGLEASCSSQEFVKVKKFKKTMGNDEAINDNAIPMDGVELDSSANSNREQAINSSITTNNGTSTANNAATGGDNLNSNLAANLQDSINRNSNQAVASDNNLAWCEEQSKLTGSTPFNVEIAQLFHQTHFTSNPLNASAEACIAPPCGGGRGSDFMGSQSSSGQGDDGALFFSTNNNHDRGAQPTTSHIRSFGDLFDDDDLD